MTRFSSNLPNGVFAASVTPLTKDFYIDHPALEKHCRWLLENGNDGICFMGTTGEANSFSVQERMIALNHLAIAGIPTEKLLVGTGCSSLEETITLTKHALSHDVSGVLVLPPFYYKQVSDDGLFDYFSLLIKRVANPSLKIYLYHFPKMTGVPFSIPLVSRLAKAYPETVVGMKDSGGDWSNMKAVLDALPGFRLYAGTEKYFLDVLNTGGAGCISATTNVSGNIASKVYKTKDSSEASKWQEKLTAAREAFEGYSFIAAVKQWLSEWHKNPDWLNIRPPNTRLNEEQINQLKKRLEGINWRP